MTFRKKTSEDLLASSIFSKFNIHSNKILKKKNSKQLPKKLIEKLIIKKYKTSYLHKYKTKELIDLIVRLNNKRINKKENIIADSIILILAKRYMTYESTIKNHQKKDPAKIIDDILFPSKTITSVAGTNLFTIVTWKQLNIEIRDRKPNNILFKKIINGTPSNHKIIKKKLDDLHLGMTTRKILKRFGCIELEESYNHPLKKKDQVSRLNKALKNLFKIPSRNNPFYWKKNKLFTDITITAFDSNNTPILPFK
tara:strand:+ start:658 stop:1419 length:762 start_codon:yes stop_codon:yes gene_type:complete